MNDTSIEFPALRFVTGAFKSNVDETGFKTNTGETCDSGTAGCSEDNDFCGPLTVEDGNMDSILVRKRRDVKHCVRLYWQ